MATHVHIWAYENAADREQRRADMQADPEWQAFLKMSAEAGNLLRQEKPDHGARAVLPAAALIPQHAAGRTGSMSSGSGRRV